MPHNERFHTYLLKDGTVDLKELAKTNQHKAEKLEEALAKVHMLKGDLCQIKEALPYSDKRFNFNSPGGSATLNFECGHQYHSAPNVWIKPMCKICQDKMEANVKANPAFWTMEEPEKKTLMEKAKETISGKPTTPPTTTKPTDKKTEKTL